MDITSVLVDPDIPGFSNPIKRKIHSIVDKKDESKGYESQAYFLENDWGEKVPIFNFFCIPFSCY